MVLTARAALLTIIAVVNQAHAAGEKDDCKARSENCVTIGRWNFSIEIGAGIRTNPLVNGKDIPLVVIPQLSYYGQRCFIDNLDVGFTIAERGSSTFNLIATPGYDRVYFYRTDLQNFFVGFPNGPADGVLVAGTTPGAIPVKARTPRITYLAGPEWTFTIVRASGQLDILRDATGQNSGYEIRGALGLPLLQSIGTLSASIGFTWKSVSTVNFYYGVPLLYTGTAALDPFLKVGYTLPVSDKWRFNAFAQYERLGNCIARSPLIAERGVTTAFVGAAYAF